MTGRPTKFRKEMCEAVIEYGKQGMSKHEMALELDISMSTFCLWQNENMEFSEAVKQAVQHSQGWWEKQGRMGSVGEVPLNPTAFIFNMKNRFKEDWRDKQEIDNTHEVSDSLTELLGALAGGSRRIGS